MKSLAKKWRRAIAHPPAGPPFTSDRMTRNEGPSFESDDVLTAGWLALSTKRTSSGTSAWAPIAVEAPCKRVWGIVSEDKGHDSASLTL